MGVAGLLALAACTPQTGPAGPYSFVGGWDCGGTPVSFTSTTYTNGADSVAIRAVTPEGADFTLYLADGSRTALAAVTQTGLTLVDGANGTQRNCRRVN